MSQAAAPPPHLQNFTPLNPRISLYEPNHAAPSAQSKTPRSPLLIVLCTWMGAQPKHIAKYTKEHAARRPHAALLLVQTSVADMLLPGRRSSLDPGVAAVRAFRAGEGGRVVVHSFSNGGAAAACAIAGALGEGGGWRFDGLVLDSCPGRVSYARTVRAMGASVAGGLGFVVRAVAMAVVRVVVAVIFLVRWVRRRDLIEEVRRELNAARGAFGRGVPRVYLYSKADQMVGWRDVRDHAAEARGEGVDVREVVFEGSQHCGHVLEDAEGYWRAVGEVVDGGEG